MPLEKQILKPWSLEEIKRDIELNYYTITLYKTDFQILGQHHYLTLSQARRELKLLKSLIYSTNTFATLIY